MKKRSGISWFFFLVFAASLIAAYWYVFALILALFVAIGIFVARRKRKQNESAMTSGTFNRPLSSNRLLTHPSAYNVPRSNPQNFVWVSHHGTAYHHNKSCAGLRSINVPMQDTGRLPPCIKCVETLAIASEISVNDRTNVFTYDFRIVGVSYNNDDGSSRQEFLKRISLRKKPFDNELRVWVFPYRFIGDHAFYVIVNGFCVGNVPADEISAVRTIYPDIIDACISVDGGDSGKYFGASCTISYKCKMTPAQIELEDDCEFYEKLLARFPNHAPKSFSAYRRMKNANTANYKKLMEAAKRWGIK